MGRYALRRLAVAVPLALAAATLVFALLETAPGSPADLWLGDRPLPPEVRARLEHAYGFDRPAPERYLRWLEAVCLHGELGWSSLRSMPVSRAIGIALPPTLLLGGAALLIHLALGLALGMWSASRRRRGREAVSLAAVVLYALPTFWLGLMAILLLAVAVPLFPPSSMASVGAEDWGTLRRAADVAWHAALPAIVLGAGSAAGLARFVRSGVLESMGQEFVRAARARGLARRQVLRAHVLRTALLPVVTLLGLSVPVLVSGSLVVEVVFAWPGMGRLTYDAIRAHDVPLVLGATLLATALVVVGNLAADLATAAVDPRVRLGRGAGGRT